MERTKLNPKISNKKKRLPQQTDPETDSYINTIKLASKGYKGDHKLNAEDRKVIQSMVEKKEKKKGWTLLCC